MLEPPVGVGVAEEASVEVAISVLLSQDIVLFVRVAVALFFVASLVLSTFHSHTSPFTIPVGDVTAGEVNVLLVSVCVSVVPTIIPVGGVGQSIKSQSAFQEAK